MYVPNCLMWRQEQQCGARGAQGLCLNQCFVDFSGAGCWPPNRTFDDTSKATVCTAVASKWNQQILYQMGLQKRWKTGPELLKTQLFSVLIFSWSVPAMGNDNYIAYPYFISGKHRNSWTRYFLLLDIVKWEGGRGENLVFMNKDHKNQNWKE